MTRRRLAALGVLLVAIAVVVVVIVSTGSSPSSPGAAASGTASGAASVERRDLVETDTEAGTLSYSDPQTVYNRLSGTITWLPAVGQVIKPGQALYKIDGEPVILMDGSVPAYRELDGDDTAGNDILELNRDLVRLGFDADGITVDDVWQLATTDGVEQLQTSLGEEATGMLPLGQVVFLPGEQLISTLDATVGSSASGSGSAPTPSDASTDVVPDPDFVSLTSADVASTTPATSDTGTMTVGTTTPATSSTTTPSSASAKKKRKQATLSKLEQLVQQLQAEVEALKAAKSPSSTPSGSSNKPSSSSDKPSSSSDKPSSSSDNPSSSSDPGSSGGGSATEILQTTSTHLVVTVDLSASSQSEAVVGEDVGVEMPAGNTVDGRISAVSSVATSSSSDDDNNGNSGSGNNGNGNGNSGSSATIPVTITLKGRHTGAGLDQAAVSVNFAEARARNVLSVPVTALLATGGGNYAVQEAAAPHKLVPVTTGLFAAGFVQISGPDIYSGLQVTDSQG